LIALELPFSAAQLTLKNKKLTGSARVGEAHSHRKDSTMKKLLLLTTAGILAAGSVQPGFAASRVQRAEPQATEQMDSVRREYYSTYGITPGFNAYARGEAPAFRTAPVQAAPSHSLPYPDRPWGAPDRW
jgi:hypothetical protein